MTTQENQELLRRLAEQIKEREQQRPKEIRMERKARVRNKYRLLEDWEAILDEYAGPGTAELVTGYRPSGMPAPVDVDEIAGLIVRDEDGVTHHLRLYRDERAAFIEIPDDPDAAIRIDPMKQPAGKRYARDGPPDAVTEILDALDLTPAWNTACPDGEHCFVLEETRFESVVCSTCGKGQAVLTWLGHEVPAEDDLD